MLQSMRSAAKYVWIVLIIAFVGGFLLVDSSGLLGRAPVTPGTVVATVNGEDILYVNWEATVQNLEVQESQRLGRGITLDERRQLEDRAFDELVNDILLRQEYERRGISVTDAEIMDAARMSPPPGVEQNPDFLTDGQFDITKYQRFLTSPIARQQGLLVGLEGYYRTEIPKQKLFDQIASDVWISDARLWQLFRDRNDSAKVSYVALRPESVTSTDVTVTDEEISAYYNSNRELFERPARAVVSLMAVERAVTAADSAAAKRRVDSLRTELVSGADFAEMAMAVSNDTSSAINGGELGRGGPGRFVAPFEEAANALRVGEVSDPVQTVFGWHLIRVDERQGDTLDLRHILIAVTQSDSSAAAADRAADRVAALATGATDPAIFDSAAVELGLPVNSTVVLENEPLNFAGRYVPGVSAWAFSGVQVGETSDLQDSPDAYYVARLDSLRAEGTAPLEDVKEDIRRELEREKRIATLEPTAARLAQTARQSSLEAAAQEMNLTVEETSRFTRGGLVPGLGQFNKAVGAAFGLAQGEISDPVTTDAGVFVLRLDEFSPADSTEFTSLKPVFRLQTVQSLKTERVQQYLSGLRESAKINDDRKQIQAALRRQVPL